MADTTEIVGVVVGGVIVVSLLAKLLGGSDKKDDGKRKVDKKLSKAIEGGDYEGAALRAAQSGDLESAYELYVRAQQPAKAAQIAIRLGRPALAGELYERAGERSRAAAAYRQAGMGHKANELEPQPASSATVPLVFGTEGKAPARMAGPAERAEQAETQWRAALREVRPNDTEACERLARYAATAAEAWLSAGDIKRAAEVYREAGLVDQAVNLYVNVLGDPASAAMLIAARGDHKRAAELFEAAGQRERSLQAWLDWSKDASDPLEHLADVKRLGSEAPSRLFNAILTERPISTATIDLHYRVGIALEAEQDPKRAKAVFERISAIEPAYRDVKQRIQTLAHAITQLSPVKAATQPPPALHRPPTQPPPVSDALDFEPLPPAAPQPAPQRSAQDLLGGDALAHLVSDVATRAAEMIKREARGTAVAPPTAPSPGVARAGAQPVMASGTTPAGMTPSIVNVQQHVHQNIDVTFQIAADAVVREAKRGPSVADLQRLIGERAPDLGNIEVYYRLGLALLARGQYEDAHKAFANVEEASPGYRDAAARASQIDEWKSKIAPSLVPGAAAGPIGKRYTLLGELGRGGMAVVFRARDEALGREVALKFLTEDAVGNEVFMQFFQREARAAGSLNHANIVTIYDVGELEGRAFICMELIDGVSIDSVLEKEKRLPLLDSLRIIEQVLIALEYAHGRKIIHRDIKPANIMQSPSGHVKLMDFGLAKSIEGQGHKTTVISGTPSYMSPEQLTGKGIDPRADLFAVGATLYEMLTGDVPFHGMVRVEAPPSVRESLPVAPTLLDQLLVRSMEFDKERRFPSATDMLVPLREILDGMGGGVKRAAPKVLLPVQSKTKAGTMLGVQPFPPAPASRVSAPGARQSIAREEPESSDPEPDGAAGSPERSGVQGPATERDEKKTKELTRKR